MACNNDNKKSIIADDDRDDNVGARSHPEAPTMRRLKAFPNFAIAGLLLKLFLEDMPVSGHAFSINKHLNDLKGDVAKLCGAEDVNIDESLIAKFLCEDVGQMLTKFEIKNEDGSLYLSAREDNEDKSAAQLLDKLGTLKTKLNRLEALKKEKFGESPPASWE